MVPPTHFEVLCCHWHALNQYFFSYLKGPIIIRSIFVLLREREGWVFFSWCPLFHVSQKFSKVTAWISTFLLPLEVISGFRQMMQDNCFFFFPQSSDRFTDIEKATGRLMKETSCSPFSCLPNIMAMQTHVLGVWSELVKWLVCSPVLGGRDGVSSLADGVEMSAKM